jgi:hypothetical protein
MIMKKLSLSVIFTLALLALPALGQVITNSPPAYVAGLEQVIALFGGSPPTNLTVGPFMTLATSGKARPGGGVVGLWNISNNVGVGGAVDYISDNFTLFAGQVNLKVPLYPFYWTHASWWTNVEIDPFGFAEVGTSLGTGTSSSSSAIIVSGLGANIPLAHFWGGSFGVAGWYENLSGAGSYSGARIGIAPNFRIDF